MVKVIWLVFIVFKVLCGEVLGEDFLGGVVEWIDLWVILVDVVLFDNVFGFVVRFLKVHDMVFLYFWDADFCLEGCGFVLFFIGVFGIGKMFLVEVLVNEIGKKFMLVWVDWLFEDFFCVLWCLVDLFLEV